MSRSYEWFLSQGGTATRILLVFAILFIAHVTVGLVRRWGSRYVAGPDAPHLSKTRTLASLLTSILVFALYFVAAGVILQEFGVSLRTYLASASILGLAIGFGSQGLVQDVVTGLTLVFSNLVDVGDMVEISGQTGIVQSVGIRFTVIENALGANVYIPNRTIANVINYPRGYVRALVDIALTDDAVVAARIEEGATRMMATMPERFPGLFRREASTEGRYATRSGSQYLRIKFRIWPGRGALIETGFKEELLTLLRSIAPDYKDWMVTVTYEVESRARPTPSREGEPSKLEPIEGLEVL